MASEGKHHLDNLLKYVSKICGLNFETVAITLPCIRFFSFR